LNNHIAKVHEGIKPFPCEVCGHKFSEKSTLKKHTASIHEEKKEYKCDICKFCCSRKSQMKLHIKNVHERKKPFECEMCGHMKEINHSSVIFVIIAVLEKAN
jgi:uncharacterized Zn-finger protein